MPGWILNQDPLLCKRSKVTFLLGFGRKQIIGFLGALILTSPFALCQQERLLVKGGYGYYEGLHVVTDYFYAPNCNLGIGIGSHLGLHPLENEKHLNLKIENNIHFGAAKRNSFKPWFTGQQLMFWRTESKSDIWWVLSVSPTLGRVIAISKRFGIVLEAGPVINLVLDVERKTQIEDGWMWPILPNGSIQLLYAF